MHLLEKKKINEQIQDQKKSQIDAGIFLAKKIDALREEVVTLEKERDEFIKGSRKVITESLQELYDSKDSLEKEIRDLEKLRKILLEPLDEEWKKVNLEKDKSILFKEELSKKSDLLNSREIAINENQELIDSRMINLSYLKGEIDKSIKDANKKQIDAKNIFAESEKYKTETNQILEGRIKELLERESSVAYREIDTNNKLKIIEEKEVQIQKDRSHIEAQRRALTAAFAELEKKKNG